MLNNLNPSEIVSLQEFYQFAKKNTPIETWDYIIGAADTETTFKKNQRICKKDRRLFSYWFTVYEPRCLQICYKKNSKINFGI